MIEVSKSKIADLRFQKIIILWTLKHVSAIIEHPVYFIGLMYKFPLKSKVVLKLQIILTDRHHE